MRLGAGQFLGRRLGLHPFDGITVTSYLYATAATLPMHEHERAYLSFPLRGSYQEHHLRFISRCGPGEGVFHPAGEAHRDRFEALGATILSIEMEEPWLDRLHDLDVRTTERWVVSGAIAERARRFARLLSLAQSVSSLRLAAGVLDLLADLPPRAPERTVPRWMARVLEHLRTSVARPSLGSLAAVAGVHPVHLARTFHQTQGCTIGAWVRRARLERAMESMRDPRHTLAEIALSCGFSDQSHLSREFRRATGASPRAFRRRR